MNYKKLKKIKKYVKESLMGANSSYAAPDNGPSLTDGSIAAFKIEDPEVLARINAFLKVFCTERHQDPKYALVVLRTKLNTLGLDFSYDGRRPLSPRESFHLTQFGGRTGVDEKGNQLNDCGISHRTGGKSMELSVEISPLNVATDAKEPGPYYIHAKIQFAEGGMNEGDTSPIDEETLLEFDPNRGKVGRKIPLAQSFLDARNQGLRGAEVNAHKRFASLSPHDQKRLNAYSRGRSFSPPHYVDENDPDYQTGSDVARSPDVEEDKVRQRRARIRAGRSRRSGSTNYVNEEIEEKKDECYYKVKAAYDVWPSAYGSMSLGKCRKVGADNWGNESEKD